MAVIARKAKFTPGLKKKKRKGFFLGGGSNTSSSSSNSYGQFNLPTWYTKYSEELLDKGRAIGNTPFKPYEDDRFEGFSGDQTAAFDAVRNNQGAFNSYGDRASAALDKAAGIDPSAMSQPFLDKAAAGPTGSEAASPYLAAAGKNWTDPGVADSYMNPYNRAVTDRIADLGARNLNEKLLPGISDAFVNSGGGFGRGTNKEFVQRALRDTQESILGQQAQVLSSGYNASANIFGSDQSRQAGLAGTAGGLANQDSTTQGNLAGMASNVGNNAIASNIALAGGNVGLGNATQAAGNTDANALLNVGNIQQQQGQKQKDFDYSEFMRENNYPLYALAGMQQATQGMQLPYNTRGESYGTQTQTQNESPLGSILGIASTVGSFFSDEREKTDRKKLGKDPKTGLMLEAYRYKGDPKSYPKVVGPMAQDIERKFPGSTREVGGKKIVKGHFAAGGHAPVVKGLRGAFSREMPGIMQRAQQKSAQAAPQPSRFARGGSTRKGALRSVC